jgi:opacity protein-like surface antigen
MAIQSSWGDITLIYRKVVVFLSLLLFTSVAHAADHLLYFEAQGIAGYSSAVKRMIFYSMNPDAEMQKPSLGFDFLKRFSGEYGDIATLALQGRLALSEDNFADKDYASTENPSKYKLEPQIYNAYLKVKTPLAYVWAGHNRPAFGLSSYFDSHGLILRTLAIQGFGYDRDWGGGLYRDFSWGDVSASVTTGSGMPIYTKGNYMTAARISYGVQSQDNFNIGFSLGYGKTLDTMGYRLRDPEPLDMSMAGIDLTVLRNNLEHRVDIYAGTWLDETTYAISYRFGINIDQEGKLKIEAQPSYWKFGGEENYQLALCVSSQVTSNLTVRLGYAYDHKEDDSSIILQLYYYLPI